MKELIKKIWNKVVNRETVMYLIFGVLTTIVNLIVYRLFDGMFAENGAVIENPNLNPFVDALNIFIQKGTANLIAWVVAVAFAYVTNRYFVFIERAHGIKNVVYEGIRFFGARVVTGVIEFFGVPFLVVIGLEIQIFKIDVAKLVISVIVVILNYVFSKIFIFKDKKDV